MFLEWLLKILHPRQTTFKQKKEHVEKGNDVVSPREIWSVRIKQYLTKQMNFCLQRLHFLWIYLNFIVFYGCHHQLSRITKVHSQLKREVQSLSYCLGHWKAKYCQVWCQRGWIQSYGNLSNVKPSILLNMTFVYHLYSNQADCFQSKCFLPFLCYIPQTLPQLPHHNITCFVIDNTRVNDIAEA